MRAVKRRPRQAVSRLPPSPYNEHPTSARNRECAPVTCASMIHIVSQGIGIRDARRADFTECAATGLHPHEQAVWLAAGGINRSARPGTR